MPRPDETGDRSGAEEGSRADYGRTSVHQRLANVTGTVVQAAEIAGGVTISVSNEPVCFDVPIVVSVRHHDGWSQVAVDGDPPELVPTCKTIAVLVEGRGPQAVVLHGLRPVVLAHRPPQPAWEVPRPIVEFAPMHVRPFIGHLGPSPRIDPPVGEPNFPFTVTASDPEQFTIVCYGAKEDTEWQLELDWTCAGRHGTVVINAEEEPSVSILKSGRLPCLHALSRTCSTPARPRSSGKSPHGKPRLRCGMATNVCTIQRPT